MIPVQYCHFKLFNVKQDWGTTDQSLIKPIILLADNQTENTNQRGGKILLSRKKVSSTNFLVSSPETGHHQKGAGEQHFQHLAAR